MAYKTSIGDVAQLLEEASDNGRFDFSIAPYEDFVEFVRTHKPDLKIQIAGKFSDEFKEELKDLAKLAYSLEA